MHRNVTCLQTPAACVVDLCTIQINLDSAFVSTAIVCSDHMVPSACIQCRIVSSSQLPVCVGCIDKVKRDSAGTIGVQYPFSGCQVFAYNPPIVYIIGFNPSRNA